MNGNGNFNKKVIFLKIDPNESIMSNLSNKILVKDFEDLICNWSYIKIESFGENLIKELSEVIRYKNQIEILKII